MEEGDQTPSRLKQKSILTNVFFGCAIFVWSADAVHEKDIIDIYEL